MHVAPAARTDPVANLPEAPILRAERANPGERRNAPSNPSHPLARTQNDIAKIVTTQSAARSALTTLPVGLRGKASTKTTSRGTLYRATLARTYSRTASMSKAAPGERTT